MRDVPVFAIFSLIGWVLDFSIYSLLVITDIFTPFIANYISSLCGATFAFSTFAYFSREAVTLRRIGIYAGYQLVAIAFFSLLLAGIASLLAGYASGPTQVDAMQVLAKIIVTPLNFIANYVTSKTLLKFIQPPSARRVVRLSPEESKQPMTKPRVLVFIPAYRCADQITRVLAQFNDNIASHVDLVLVVDNQSPDNTIQAASDYLPNMPDGLNVRVSRNHDNFGLGGSHKVAFTYAKENKFDYLIVLHGDDQATIRDLEPYLASGEAFAHDCFMGSRFDMDSTLLGYSLLRRFGNIVYNALFSVVAGKIVTDLGSGLNMYSLDQIDLDEIHGFPDDLTFNYVMLLWSLRKKHDVKFFPISWREEDQVSNVKLTRQAFRVLGLLGQRFTSPEKFFKTDHRDKQHERYTGEVVSSTQELQAP